MTDLSKAEEEQEVELLILCLNVKAFYSGLVIRSLIEEAVVIYKNCSSRFPDYIHTHRGGDRGHAEEDSGTGLRHPPGPC